MDVSNVSWKQTWGDYTTNVIDYDYVPQFFVFPEKNSFIP